MSYSQLKIRHPKDVPVSTFIAVSLVVVFLLYNAKVLNALPCGNSFQEVFCSNFCHIEIVHLLSNLFSLYALSTVEQQMGFKPFAWLMIFLLLFNTLAEYFVKKLLNYSKCSIGFSGILFGVMTWDIISKKKIDLEVAAAILISVFSPSLTGKNISFTGHAIGAFSGIIGALLWKVINKE